MTVETSQKNVSITYTDVNEIIPTNNGVKVLLRKTGEDIIINLRDIFRIT